MTRATAHKILVYDLGGGTFDVSLMEVGDGVFEVLATAGNNRLGGDDFDNRLIDYIADEFKKENGIDLRQDRMALQRLKEAAEKAKIELSGTDDRQRQPAVHHRGRHRPQASGHDPHPREVQRADRRSGREDHRPAAIRRCRDAGLTATDIDKVILVGGSTRIPAVQEAVQRVTGKEPYKGINPDECVAIGAAIQGGVLGGDVKDVLLLDVTPAVPGH